jgi:hypothetical protein
MDLQHFLTNAWRWKCGLNETAPVKMPSLESLRNSERSPRFEQYRLNRKIMGAFRYGLFGDPAKPKYNRIDSIIKRVELYKATGNDELLCDIANIAELEFEEGTHPLKHFASVDDGEHVAVIGSECVHDPVGAAGVLTCRKCKEILVD